MAEARINGNFRIMDGSTNLRTLKEINTLLTTINNNVNKILPVSLFENTNGTVNNITLSETAANFGLIDIMYSKGSYHQSVRVWKPNGKIVSLIMGYTDNNTDMQIQGPTITISGTTITRRNSGGVNLGSGGIVNVFKGNEVAIHKVIGYRISI